MIDQHWLRSRQFDLYFIVGIALLAIISGLLVVIQPTTFIYVLTADLWLLGYHHVASTYTRIAFDKQSLQEHKYKLTVLPVLVAVSVTGIFLTFGPWMLATIYFHWQWYHYTRQSEGISKAYAAKSGRAPLIDARLNRVIFWLLPVAGIVNTSARSHDTFLFMPIETIAYPVSIVTTINIVTATTYLWWLMSHAIAIRTGRVALPWFLYMNSHFLIYSIAYIFIENINFGWLVINIWHNAQYILFVWLFNNKRFKGQLSKKHPFLSTISKNRNLLMYLGVCFALSTGAYHLIENYGVDVIEITFGVSGMAAAMIIYQTINFHHYIVDASIWKLRKKPIRDTLGLNP